MRQAASLTQPLGPTPCALLPRRLNGWYDALKWEQILSVESWPWGAVNLNGTERSAIGAGYLYINCRKDDTIELGCAADGTKGNLGWYNNGARVSSGCRRPPCPCLQACAR